MAAVAPETCAGDFSVRDVDLNDAPLCEECRAIRISRPVRIPVRFPTHADLHDSSLNVNTNAATIIGGKVALIVNGSCLCQTASDHGGALALRDS